MYAFILIVTITLQAADAGPPRSFILKSDDQYSQPICEKRAQAAADRMGADLSATTEGNVSIMRSCVLLETRNI